MIHEVRHEVVLRYEQFEYSDGGMFMAEGRRGAWIEYECQISGMMFIFVFIYIHTHFHVHVNIHINADNNNDVSTRT